MADFVPSFWRRYRLSAAGRSLALVLLVSGGLCSSPCHADPGDFAAMPGLWKIVTTPVDHGRRGKPVIEWHCVDEGADPWTAFAAVPLPALAPCQRSNPHRSSTDLTWEVSCGGNSQGRGRVGFDSAEHYTASIVLQDRGEIVHVEGQRRAACTGPSD
ncbi:MAG TPA: DUF3617 family protein [Rhodanobacter sp.]|jgi:hypothetical protein|nr:DUF3617 family protein [Rhodanobacter sp.]